MSDEFYFTTAALLPFDGADGSTTITNHAFQPQPVTVFGNARLSTTESKAGGSSLYLDGTGDYLTMPIHSQRINSGGGAFLTSDFTISTWIKTAKADTVIVSSYEGSTGWELRIQADGKVAMRLLPSLTNIVVGTGSVTDNAWHHVEVVRSSSTNMHIFVDGVLQTTAAIAAATLVHNQATLASICIGAYNYSRGAPDIARDFSGYMDGLLINIKTAYHSANFTPAAALDTTPRSMFGIATARHIDLGVAPAVPPIAYKLLAIEQKLYDMNYGGRGRVSGTTKLDGTPDTPVSRRVRLFREVDGTLVREQWSNPTTGAYSFDNIDANVAYTVVTYDYLHSFRAVIADNITPDPMP